VIEILIKRERTEAYYYIYLKKVTTTTTVHNHNSLGMVGEKEGGGAKGTNIWKYECA
jgi:hypothetical protein